jgi:endonuclease G, mitochondrial
MVEGFDSSFLSGVRVDLPVPATDTVRADLRPTKSGAAVRDCTHFSLSISASRRLCRWVAWNVDGASKQPAKTPREFRFDPAYSRTDQIGAPLYEHNHLDQGHVAAYADVSWGGVSEAAEARKESCYFSNVTPQLDTFNRSDLKGIWGCLEAEIAKENKVDEQRLSEIGGPVLSSDDPVYEQIQVPREFWKIVAFVEGGVLKAKAFVLTQKDLDHDLALLPLEQFRIYQHRVAELGDTVGLDFAALAAADTASRPAAAVATAASPVRRITSLADVNAPGW